MSIIRPYHNKLVGIVRAVDATVIYVSQWVVLELMGMDTSLPYAFVAIAAVLVYEFIAEYNEVYYLWRGSAMHREALRIAVSWLLTIFVIIFGIFVSGYSHQFSNMVIGFWTICALAAILVLHVSRRLILRYLRLHSRNTRTVAIAGANALGTRVFEALQSMPWLGYKILGFYDDRLDERRKVLLYADLIGDFKRLYMDAKNRQVDVIYITLPMKSEDRIKEIIRVLADTTVSVYFVPDLFVFDMVHARWNIIQGLPAVSVYETPFQSFDSFIKRQMDILITIFILALISMPMLIIAVAVHLSSPGPVLFKQRRYGIRGEEIEVWKFRTMAVCEDGADVKQAVRNDPRVTRLGKFLRKTSLDELPQFINVLQGRMSIVGPRPHAVSHNEYYRNLVHGYMLRHKVRPGITGLAQVHGYRGETENVEKMQKRILYDLEYIRHWSPWLDIKIIFMTIFRVVSAGDAY